MDFLSIGALILRSLQVIGNNPALGGGSSLRMDEISELLGIFGQLFERGDEALEELEAFADIVESMAKEGRAPTRIEWDTLRGRSDAAHETIQEAAVVAAEELEEEEEENNPPTPGGSGGHDDEGEEEEDEDDNENSHSD